MISERKVDFNVSMSGVVNNSSGVFSYVTCFLHILLGVLYSVMQIFERELMILTYVTIMILYGTSSG